MASRAPLCPARLEPVFSPRPWGARSLAPLFPEKSDLAEPLGEAWLTGNECRFASGPFAGKKLGRSLARNARRMDRDRLNSQTRPFPLAR